MINNSIGYMICETANEPTKPIIKTIKNDRVEIEADLQDVEVVNRNTRLYKEDDMIREINSDRILELINADGLYGEAGHPLEKDLSRQQTIDPTRMSHRFKKLWMEKNVVKSICRAAATQRGDDFHRTILDGTKVSFSLRALGSIEMMNKIAVVRNLKVITWDWVIFPSHSIAYMRRIINNPLNESATGLINKGKSNFIIDEKRDHGTIIPITNKVVKEFIQESSENVKYVMDNLDFMYESIDVDTKTNRVILRDKTGVTMYINLESHIQNKLMDYCESIIK